MSELFVLAIIIQYSTHLFLGTLTESSVLYAISVSSGGLGMAAVCVHEENVQDFIPILAPNNPFFSTDLKKSIT